jgi:hypothetical protein
LRAEVAEDYFTIALEDMFAEFSGTDTLTGHGDKVKPGDVVDVYFNEPDRGVRDVICHAGVTLKGISGTDVAYVTDEGGLGMFSAGQVNGSWWRTFKVIVPA